MCGLTAIYAYGADAPPVDAARLAAIHDAMAARGPDGEGRAIAPDGRLAMAHRRLAILDPTEAGAQPMETPDGRYRIVFNGEIYNYRALRAELEADGVAFRSNTDTEVLLHLYARRGAAMVEALRGMFAFALWDSDRKGLFLARDPYGIKPLYYADDGRTVAAASQVKALLAGGGIDGAEDAAGHVGFFLFGYVPEPHTLYRGIAALPAGHRMWIDAKGCGAPQKWFDLPAEIARAAPGPVAPDALRDALADSVSHHLIADVPVGAFLSSGLDSATLVALAAETKGTELRTVTLGFDEYRGTSDDETPLAEQIARQYGTSHQTRRIARDDFEAETERLFAAMDQPSIDGVNTYFVARAAAATGLKVALSGLGGDELFAGYSSFREVPALVRALAPFRLLPGVGRALRVVSAPLVRRLTSPKYAGLIEYGTRHADAYLLRRGLFMPWELPDILPPELVRDGLAALAPCARLAETVDGIGFARGRLIALESCWYMRNQLLRDADWAGMAHSLEIRTPLVDATLLRALAPSIASRRPPGKRDMALTPRTPLPDTVLNRPKTGFSVPVRDWIGDTDERGHRGWARRVYDRFVPA